MYHLCWARSRVVGCSAATAWRWVQARQQLELAGETGGVHAQPARARCRGHAATCIRRPRARNRDLAPLIAQLPFPQRLCVSTPFETNPTKFPTEIVPAVLAVTCCGSEREGEGVAWNCLLGGRRHGQVQDAQTQSCATGLLPRKGQFVMPLLEVSTRWRLPPGDTVPILPSPVSRTHSAD